MSAAQSAMMHVDGPILVFFAVAATLVLLVRSGGSRAPAAWVAAGTIVLTGMSVEVYTPVVDTRLRDELPLQQARGDYAPSDTCQSCHPDEYASWHRSYHRTMTQIASPQSVRGDFEDVLLESRGLTYHLMRRGDEFFVEMPDPDADFANREEEENFRILERDPELPRAVKRVVLTTGSHFMQTYWVPGDAGRSLRNLPFLYLFADDRWVPREDAFMRPPTAGRMMPEWGSNCIKCHSTRPNPAYDFGTDRQNTEVLEFGIACAACHGAAGKHIAANQNPLRRYSYHFSGEDDPTIVNPEKLSSRAASQVCGQCHGIYTPYDVVSFATKGSTYDAGEDIEETRYYLRHPYNKNQPNDKPGLDPSPEFVEQYYWPDGTVRATGREYQSMTESPCALRGELSCMSCHSMHKSDPHDQVAQDMYGPAACLQCHGDMRGQIEEHTHHGVDSTGSDCYNCHMARTSYGLLTAIRSHQIDSPSLSTLTQAGRPNACNLCHLDKTLAWTGRYLTEWYDQPTVSLGDDQQVIAASILWAMRGNCAQRAIVAWHMGWEPAQQASGKGWTGGLLAHLLDDPYSAVRYIAYESLRTTPGFADFEFDFIAPEADRQHRSIDAIERWLEIARTIIDRTGVEVCWTDAGSWRRDVIDILLRQRDDQELYLAE